MTSDARSPLTMRSTRDSCPRRSYRDGDVVEYGDYDVRTAARLPDRQGSADCVLARSASCRTSAHTLGVRNA